MRLSKKLPNKKTVPESPRAWQRMLSGRRLDLLAAEYEKRFGQRPARVSQMVQSGLVRSAPTDLLGFPYVIGDDGKAQLHPDSPLLEKKALFEKLQ